MYDREREERENVTPEEGDLGQDSDDCLSKCIKEEWKVKELDDETLC